MLTNDQRFTPANKGDPDTERPQALQLDASASVDDDDIATIPFDFTWRCESQSGDICISGTGQTLNVSSSENEAILSIPANSLPTGKLMKVTTVACYSMYTELFPLGPQVSPL